MMKHIKLFEGFVTEAEEQELSKREQSILNRGLDVMSEAQGAFCFCVASGWVNDLKVGDSNTPFRNVAPMDKDWPEWTEIKQQSIQHAVRKMKKHMGLIDPEAEYSTGDKPYPKLINFCNKFADMKKADVLALASECIKGPDEETIEEFRPKPAEKLSNKEIDNMWGRISPLIVRFETGGMSHAEAVVKAKKMIVTQDKGKSEPTEMAYLDKVYAAGIKRNTAKSIR